MTPPALLVAHIRMGLRLSCCAVIFCKPPNKAFEDVSLPVRATPSQPIKVPKKGKNQPVRVKARLKAENDTRKEGRQEAARSRGSEPVEIEPRGFGGGLLHNGRRTKHFGMQIR